MLNRSRLAAISLFLIATAFPIAAQEFSVGNLPADTSFMIYYHGQAPLKAADSNNPMLKFWYGPESAQFRVQWLQFMIRQSNLKANGHPFNPSAENADRFLSLMECPIIVGVSSSEDLMALAQSASKPSDKIMNSVGFFFILDFAGKNAQFDQLWPQIEAEIPADVTRSKIESSGTSIEVFTGPNSPSFSARAGHYFVWSNKRKVIEDLIPRLRGGATSTKSLAQDAYFTRTRGNPDPGTLIEFFFRVPDLSKIPVPANPMVNTSAVLQGFHLDAIHAAYGSISVTSDSFRSRGFILADPSVGGIFALAGANKGRFETLLLAPASAYSINVGSIDLPAIYKAARSAIVAALPPEQQSSVAMVETVGAGQLGMPIPDALALFRGEIASIQLDSKTSSAPQLLALTITDSQQILSLIHKVGAERILSEKQENGVAYLTFGAASVPGASTAPDPTQYHVAVAPHVLLASANAQFVRDTVARLGTSGSASLADNPELVKLRAALPREVISLQFTDYSRYDWEAVISGAFDKMGTQRKANLSPDDVKFLESLKSFPWASMTSTLHWSVGAWWRDADGIHFESNSK